MMHDLSGKQYDLWFVTDEHKKVGKHVLWLCRCECGHEKFVYATNLTRGVSGGCKSCSAKRHGMTGTVEHDAWKNMLARCSREDHPEFENYGRRGITVCDRWLLFENFYADMGNRPDSEHSLGRKDNGKGYCKENCRWETTEQQHNNKRTNVLLEFNGTTKTLTQWARECGIRVNTLQGRITRGWPISDALITPVKKKRLNVTRRIT